MSKDLLNRVFEGFVERLEELENGGRESVFGTIPRGYFSDLSAWRLRNETLTQFEFIYQCREEGLTAFPEEPLNKTPPRQREAAPGDREYPRADIWIKDNGREYWIEMKVIATTYKSGKDYIDHGKDTGGQVNSLVDDAGKLKENIEDGKCFILPIVYPLFTDKEHRWQTHLEKFQDVAITDNPPLYGSKTIDGESTIRLQSDRIEEQPRLWTALYQVK